MPDRIVVSGIKPYDGEYELDVEHEPFTTLEWRWVKTIAGYLPLTISDGMAGADPSLFVTFAVIAMRRAGRIDKDEVQAVAERLSDAPFGSAITIEGDPVVEADEPPLGLTPEPSGPSEPDRTSSDSSTSRQPPTSGNGSTTSSAPSGDDPKRIGTSGSEPSPALSVVGQAN